MRSEPNHVKPVADGVWIVDAGRIHPAGFPLSVRMTVIRLASGDLLLHSPTQYSPTLRGELERLGPIKYLLAPNVAHWMFLPEWQAALPMAKLFAAPGLGERAQVRRAGLRIDHELGDRTPNEWSDDLELVLVNALFFSEVELFHKPSRTLVLTDIVQNLAPQGLPPLARGVANLLGITAPNGRAPAYLRLLLRLGGRSVQTAVARLIELAPARVIFAHGRWFESGGTEQLRRAFAWLKRPRASLAAPQDLSKLRVVVTGASSGIGRATALMLARRGASVALAARRAEVLNDLAAECNALGGRAIAVATDVTDADAVQRLATTADTTFGGIDVWINNAGTGVFGPFQDAPLDLHRRTVEVNLFGAMHGAYAVLPRFLERRRGILVNMVSLGGWAPAPFAAAYTASKFGLRGFSASLRQELRRHAHIHVCAVFPAMVDTPGFVHSANVSGRTLDPGPMLYAPEEVAETLVHVVRHPRDEIAVGWPARAAQMAYALAPGPTEHLMGLALNRTLERAGPAPKTYGALRRPVPDGTASDGGWLERKRLPSASTLSGIGVAVLGAGVALALGSRLGGRSGRSKR